MVLKWHLGSRVAKWQISANRGERLYMATGPNPCATHAGATCGRPSDTNAQCAPADGNRLWQAPAARSIGNALRRAALHVAYQFEARCLAPAATRRELNL